MDGLSQQIDTLLLEHKNHSRLRQLKTSTITGPTTITINGKALINFASNDYLGLSQHPLLKERAIKAIEQYGVGNPSSRLISGNCELYDTVETEIAKLKGTEAALVFPTGFQANVTVLPALSKLNGFFLCDRLSHNSTLLGIQLANRNFERFAHNNVDELQELLARHAGKAVWVITESVFSMDGDLAPINELITLSKKTQSCLYVDEAHATGVFGENGMGLVHKPDRNTVVMGTFGKGCGSFGAYIACSSQLKDYLINFCSGIIYTTALPPPVLASIQAALELIPYMVLERQDLLKRASLLRAELQKIGFDTGQSNSPIICLNIGGNELALSLSHYLEENKIYARAIRPPTVPENTARIRLSLSAAHSNADIEHLIKTLKQWYERN